MAGGLALPTILGSAIPSHADSGSSSAAVQAAPRWTYDPSETQHPSDVAARAAMENVSIEEAVRRFHVEDAASALSAQVQAQYPDTFGGIWESHDPFCIVVAFTRDASENQAKLRAVFPFPNDLHTVTSSLHMQR